MPTIKPCLNTSPFPTPTPLKRRVSESAFPIFVLSGKNHLQEDDEEGREKNCRRPNTQYCLKKMSCPDPTDVEGDAVTVDVNSSIPRDTEVDLLLMMPYFITLPLSSQF